MNRLSFALCALVFSGMAAGGTPRSGLDAASPITIHASEHTEVLYAGNPLPGFSGALDADDATYNRVVSCAALSITATAVAFDTVTITNGTTAHADLTVSSTLPGGGPCGDDSDTFFTLYSSFDPAMPLQNCLAVNDDISGSANRCSHLRIALPPGARRTVAIAGFGNAALPNGLFAYQVNLAGPVLTITPTTLAFGNQWIGSLSDSRTLTLANISATPLAVTALGMPTAPFTRTGGSCAGTLPFSIGAGANCTLSYAVAPLTPTPAAQTLLVSTDPAGGGSITLTAIGVSVQQLPAGHAPGLWVLCLLLAGFGAWVLHGRR